MTHKSETLRIERTADMRLVREMLEEYGRATGVDLSFQDFDHEIESLPYEYDPILIAYVDDRAAGCVALRRIDDAICEMKRLYVRPTFRGHALGRRLAEAIIAEAKQHGFQRMRLDTLPSMNEAIALYESLGFVDIAPYRFTRSSGLDISSYCFTNSTRRESGSDEQSIRSDCFYRPRT